MATLPAAGVIQQQSARIMMCAHQCSITHYMLGMMYVSVISTAANCIAISMGTDASLYDAQLLCHVYRRLQRD